MKQQTKQRLAAVAALAVAAGVLGYLSMGGIGKNLVYFWGPEEMLDRGDEAYGVTIRLGGVVQPGSYKWDAETLDLQFDVTDMPTEDARRVTVHAKGAPPQMFREGIGVVVEGTYDGKVFSGDRVIVKHSNEYHPPEEGEKPTDLYKTLVTEN